MVQPQVPEYGPTTKRPGDPARPRHTSTTYPRCHSPPLSSHIAGCVRVKRPPWSDGSASKTKSSLIIAGVSRGVFRPLDAICDASAHFSSRLTKLTHANLARAAALSLAPSPLHHLEGLHFEKPRFPGWIEFVDLETPDRQLATSTAASASRSWRDNTGTMFDIRQPVPFISLCIRLITAMDYINFVVAHMWLVPSNPNPFAYTIPDLRENCGRARFFVQGCKWKAPSRQAFPIAA